MGLVLPPRLFRVTPAKGSSPGYDPNWTCDIGNQFVFPGPRVRMLPFFALARVGSHDAHPIADMFLRTKILLPQREKDSLEMFVSAHIRFRLGACFSSQGNFHASRGDTFL